LNAYGHAYSRPNDFTAAQYTKITSDFKIFTVEKEHAVNVYGNHSARRPFNTNSIAATVGTARKIKALKPSTKVLMYWNAAIHFNFYECESEVQASWTYPDPSGKNRIFYNYSVPAFRDWWVKCAIDAVHGSEGALSGLFFDAIPKVDKAFGIVEWGKMVDEIRKALGPDAILLDNGFFLKQKLAGTDAWAHTGWSYVESLKTIGTSPTFTPEQDVQAMSWLANASRAYPNRTLVGHGDISTKSGAVAGALDPKFVFGLAKYLLITSSSENGWFLANDGGYSIDDGLLDQPSSVYQSADGVGCGEPTAPFQRVGGSSSHKLHRLFEKGSVTVDFDTQTASIDCTGTSPG
jgi:hypothetical protein